MDQVSCKRCGSPRIRRVRSRTLVKRAYGSLSSQHRYNCEACHHRGWTRSYVPRVEGEFAPVAPATPGRPLEARDYRAARADRLRTTGMVLAAAVVGATLAILMAGLLP